MGLDELLPRHAARPQTRAQAVQQIGERAGALGLVRALPFALRGLQRLGEETGQTHQLDAEAGVDLLLGAAGEALGEQPRDRARLAERPAGGDADAAHVAVDAKEGELQPPRALGLAREQRGEIVGEPGERRHDRLARENRAGEAPLGAKIGRGEARRDRLARETAQRVEPRDRLRAEARGDRRARPDREIADAAQASARHVGARFVVEPQRGDRHFVIELGEGLAGKADGSDALAGIARQRPGGARRVGEAEREREPLGREARLDLLRQRRLAAEEMRDAGNVEHQPIAPIERDERREAGAPIGEALEQPRLRLRVGLDRDKGGMARARVGERQAGGEAEPRGVRVDADEPACLSDRRDDRQRRGRVNGARAPRAVRRQTRQPEGEKPSDRQIAGPRFARSGGRFSSRRGLAAAPEPTSGAP